MKNQMQGSDIFKSKTLEQRRKEYFELKKKYPDRTPTIIHYEESFCKMVENKRVVESHCKFLVPSNTTIGELTAIIRGKVKLTSSDAVFVFHEAILMNGASKLSDVWFENKSEDGFLYLNFTRENAFG